MSAPIAGSEAVPMDAPDGRPNQGQPPAETSGALLCRAFRPTDIASLVLFRVLFGGFLVWEVCRYFEHDWIRRYYIAPRFRFHYFGFEWVGPWPGDGMYWHFAGLGVVALCIAIGLCYRASAILFFLGFTYVFLLDQAQYLNHFYLISLIGFLMVFVPAHCTASVDAFLRPRLRSDTVPAWALWILRAQVGIAYFYGGIAKLNSDWLAGEPMRMWLAKRTDFPLVGPLFTEEWVVYAFSYGGLCIDLGMVPLLVWRRTRWLAFGIALFFHVMNSLLFHIGIFPWLMLAATLLFFPADWPRRVLNWPRREPGPAGSEPRLHASLAAKRLVAGLLAAYLAVQLLVPLRHFLYPGDVSWTEEGHNFSWHMKVRDKSARGEFWATDPASGRSWKIGPRKYLSGRQHSKMLNRPDLVLQFCHHLAEKLREEGHERIEVCAKIRVSMNGREYQDLIDPDVDLAAVSRSLAPAPWIRPLVTPLRDPRTVRRDDQGESSDVE